MVKAPIYTIKGTKTGEFTLPKEMFEQKPNLNLLAQAIYVYEDRLHVGLRKTKTRAEINRTTKKVYKQKGTGGARHGSRRANLFVGGGVALGPRPLKRTLSLSDALKKTAKTYAFSIKAGEKQIVVADGLTKIEKTKEAAILVKKLAEEFKTKSFTFILSEKNGSVNMFLRNLGNAKAIPYKDINAYDIWNGGLLMLDSDIFEKEKPVKKVTEKPAKKVAVKKVTVKKAK
jgi:large subunit ribosomal protein L4